MAELITVEDLAVKLQQDITDEFRVIAQDCVDQANGHLMTFTRGQVDAGTTTLTVVAAGVVTLPRQPVRKVEAVTVNGESTDDWMLATDRQTIAVGGDGDVVTVTYSYGWNGPWGNAARSVAMRMASRFFSNPVSRTSYSNPAGAWSASESMVARIATPDELSILAGIGGGSFAGQT